MAWVWITEEEAESMGIGLGELVDAANSKVMPEGDIIYRDVTQTS